MISTVKQPWLIVAVVAFIASILLPAPIYVRQDLGWIDAISGSQKTQTLWRVGRSSLPFIIESPLAARYRKLGLTWEPDWRNVKGTYVNALGRHVGSGHGFAPEIYDLATSADLQNAYIAASTDDDIRQFFHTMTTGTDTLKKAAVTQACDKALDHLSTM